MILAGAFFVSFPGIKAPVTYHFCRNTTTFAKSIAKILIFSKIRMRGRAIWLLPKAFFRRKWICGREN